MADKLRHIDLSHIVEDGMITYKGLPAPIICDWMSREQSRSRYAEGTEFHIGKIEMIANTGTYIDSPFHRYADGIDVSELPLDQLARVECVVIRVAHDVTSIGEEAFRGVNLRGKAVLVNTERAHCYPAAQAPSNISSIRGLTRRLIACRRAFPRGPDRAGTGRSPR